MSFQLLLLVLILMKHFPKNNKRISNNAKIRFDAVFDLGQNVSASVLEQDLVSYTYFTAGLNVRYNHSSKFGIGAEQTIPYRNIRLDQQDLVPTKIFLHYLSHFYIFTRRNLTFTPNIHFHALKVKVLSLT